MPTLLHSTSTVPKAATARSTVARQPSWVARSACRKTAAPPAAVILSTRAAPASASRSTTSTLAPAAAAASAMPPPMPSAPPVTTNDLPASVGEGSCMTSRHRITATGNESAQAGAGILARRPRERALRRTPGQVGMGRSAAPQATVTGAW